MQRRICQRCGNPIHGQSVNQIPGPGPVHPTCWEDHKEEDQLDMWGIFGLEELSSSTSSSFAVDGDKREWTKELPQEPGYYWRSRDGEETDDLYEIGYGGTDQLHIIYSPGVTVRVSYFKGDWWRGPVSEPDPPLNN